MWNKIERMNTQKRSRVDQHMDSFQYVSTVSFVFLVSIGCDDACKIKYFFIRIGIFFLCLSFYRKLSVTESIPFEFFHVLWPRTTLPTDLLGGGRNNYTTFFVIRTSFA